jgi:hypothetical protein
MHLLLILLTLCRRAFVPAPALIPVRVRAPRRTR